MSSVEQTTEELVALLENGVLWRAWGTMNGLIARGKAGDTRIVKPLLAALTHHNSFVRYIAAEALGQLDDPRAVEPLIAALADEDGTVRRRAAGALRAIGDERGVQPLIAVLNDADPTVRRRAAIELRRFGDGHAVEPLIATLRDVDAEVRRHTAVSLGQLGGERAIAPLMRVLGQPREYRRVRRAAVDALAHLSPPAIDSLLEVLTYPDREVRTWAAKALGRLGDRRASPL